MRVVVHNDLSDLAADMRAIPSKFKAKAPGVVRKNVSAGNKIAQGIARARSGPHGAAYWKRLTWESAGLQGEYGPHDGGTPVGGGWRHGRNTDLPPSADQIGPKFAKDVGDLADGLFW